jgi:hypothetical protein
MQACAAVSFFAGVYLEQPLKFCRACINFCRLRAFEHYAAQPGAAGFG